MASKWEPHAEEIEALFRRGDSYRAISAILQERHGLPLDPAGLHRWWKNKLAKRQAREAALRNLAIESTAPVTSEAAAQANELTQKNAVKEAQSNKTDGVEHKKVNEAKSMKEIIAAAESSVNRTLLSK